MKDGWRHAEGGYLIAYKDGQPRLWFASRTSAGLGTSTPDFNHPDAQAVLCRPWGTIIGAYQRTQRNSYPEYESEVGWRHPLTPVDDWANEVVVRL